jgi:hypothetical protein
MICDKKKKKKKDYYMSIYAVYTPYELDNHDLIIIFYYF